MASPSEYCRTQFKLPNDRRALGAVLGAVEHSARHLGFPTPQEQHLTAAAERLLSTAMAGLGAEAEVTLTIQEHPNRIEIELIRSGAGAGEWAALRGLEGIDRVEEETAAGRTRLKLVKFLGGGSHPHEH